MPPQDNLLEQIAAENQSAPIPNVLGQRPAMPADYAAQVQTIQTNDMEAARQRQIQAEAQARDNALKTTTSAPLPSGPVDALAAWAIPGYQNIEDARARNLEKGIVQPIDPSIYTAEARPTAAPTTTDQMSETGKQRSAVSEAALAKGEAGQARNDAALNARDASLAKNSSEAEKSRLKFDEEMQATKEAAANRMAKLTSESEKYKEELNKQRLAAQSIKPEDFWQDSSTGQKVAMSLAIMAGGLSQGIARNPNGPNPAAESLKNAINADMQKYAAKMSAATSGMDATGKMLDVVSKQINDAQVGYNLHKVILGDQLKGTLDSLERQAQNDKARAEITKIKGDLEQQQIKNVVAYEDSVAKATKRDYEVKRLMTQVAPESQAQLKDLTPAEQSKLLVSIDQRNKMQASIMGVDPMTLPAYTLQGKATDAQQKAIQFANQAEIDLYRMENTEKTLPPEKMGALRVALDEALKDRISGEKSPSLLGISPGKSWEEWHADFGADMVAKAEKAAGPEGAAYARALMSFANDMTRAASGAAIQNAEFYATAVQKAHMAPSLGADGQRDVKNSRRTWTESAINIATGGQQRAPAHLTPGK